MKDQGWSWTLWRYGLVSLVSLGMIFNERKLVLGPAHVKVKVKVKVKMKKFRNIEVLL